MKKLIIAAILLTATMTNAQDKSMSFGVKGGLNLATTSADGAKSLIGFHVGGFAEFMITDKFAVQPELTFSAQGAKYKNVLGNEFNYNLNYLNLPVMAKYFVTEDLSLEFGPQISFLMSAKADGTDVKESYNSTDFGVNFGAGFNLNENMVLGLRYNLGLSDLEKDLSPGEKGTKQSVLQFSFGYKF